MKMTRNTIRKHLRDDGRSLWLVCVLVVLLAAACTSSGGAGNPSYAVEQSLGQEGSVQFFLRVSDTTISTSDTVALQIETRAGEAWRLSWPQVGTTLGDFSVSVREPSRRVLGRDGILTTTVTYALEPDLPGNYTIPPVEVSFGGADDAGYPFTLASDPVQVSVQSVLPPGVGEQDLEAEEGPAAPPPGALPWLIVAAALLVAAAGAGGTVMLRSRAAVQLPMEAGLDARSEALAELDALVTSGIIEEAKWDEYYVRLSGLVRRYIERRFSIRAREQTTEEFLEHARQAEQLSAYRELLRGFLEYADRVKFARHTPDPQEAQKAAELCRRFVNESSLENRL